MSQNIILSNQIIHYPAENPKRKPDENWELSPLQAYEPAQSPENCVQPRERWIQPFSSPHEHQSNPIQNY